MSSGESTQEGGSHRVVGGAVMVMLEWGGGGAGYMLCVFVCVMTRRGTG